LLQNFNGSYEVRYIKHVKKLSANGVGIGIQVILLLPLLVVSEDALKISRSCNKAVD
jgi:hypothetical protein